MTLKMDSINEIMRLCRLCLAKDEVNTPIFEEHGDIKQILLKISACLPVKVSKEDNLPKNICDGCSCKLEMLYHFWSTSANSEKKLIKLLDQIGVNKLSDNNELPMPSSLQSQQHSISSDPVVLKQEVVDVIDSQSVEEDLVHEDLIVTNDQDYLLEQEQIPYQPVEFQFQQDGFETVTAEDESTNVDTKPESESKPRKRRAAAMKALATMESEDEDDPDLIDTKIAKTEEQSDESAGEDPEPTTFVGLPSADDEQPGPSGVGKPSSDAPPIAGPPRNTQLKFLNQCEICLTIFANTRRLSDHRYTHIQERPHPCKICSKSFKRKSHLSAHVKKMHQGRKYYQCDICNKKLLSEKSLKIHKDHHVKKYRVYCSFCNKGFDNHYPMREHILSVHEKNIYECKICGKPLASRSSLLCHMKIHNENHIAKNFKCKLCDKSFTRKSSLAVHSNSHIGYKYMCHMCGLALSSKTTLKQHFLSHSKVKPHKCQFCDKSFTRLGYLNSHLRTHSGEKPYKCQVCQNSFAQRFSIVIHMRNHTGEKPYKCDLCEYACVSRNHLNFHRKSKHRIIP